MKEVNTKIRDSLSVLYAYASDTLKQDMIEARTEFDRLIPLPPINDTEMHNRLIMFSHWFLMDRQAHPGKTPAGLFYEDRLLSFSYEDEEIYRALRISTIGIYEVTGSQQKKIAIDTATDERFGFLMDDGMAMQANKEVMTMRFLRLKDNAVLLASYCTHHYSTRDFIRTELNSIEPFDRTAFSAKVLELSALSIKSRKYNWVAPIMIYKGMTRL